VEKNGWRNILAYILGRNGNKNDHENVAEAVGQVPRKDAAIINKDSSENGQMVKASLDSHLSYI